jgi:hypothetical protein
MASATLERNPGMKPAIAFGTTARNACVPRKVVGPWTA